MILVPGLGDKKVKRLYQALHEPFRSVKPKNKEVSDLGIHKSSSSSSSGKESGIDGSNKSSSSSNESVFNSSRNSSSKIDGNSSDNSGKNVTSDLNTADGDIADSNAFHENGSAAEKVVAVSAPT